MNAKLKLSVVIGILITTLPLLGIPRGAKDISLFILGGTIVLMSVLLRKQIKLLRLKLKRLEGQQGTLIQ